MMDINRLDGKGLVRFLRREGVQFKEGEEEALIREKIEGNDALEMSLQDWRMIGLSFPTAKRVIAAISSPPSSQGNSARMKKGKQGARKENSVNDIVNGVEEVQIQQAEGSNSVSAPHSEEAIAAADSRILREKFEKLESEALVEFLRGQGLKISVKTAENLILNEVSGKTLVMKPMDELIAFFVNMAKLGVGPADAIAQFVFTTFAVRVPVKIGTSQARSVTLGPNATLESLLRHLTASNEYGIEKVPFNELLIKFNGLDKLVDHNIRLETLTKQLSEDQPLLISKMEVDVMAALHEDFKSMRKPQGFPSKIHELTPFAQSLAFEGRESLLTDFPRFLSKNLFKRGRDSSFFPVLAGTPGLGKTRAINEINRWLQREVESEASIKIGSDSLEGFKVVHIYSTFNGSTGFFPCETNDLKEFGAEGSLAARLYHAHYIDPNKLNFQTFIIQTTAKGYHKKLTLKALLERIQQDLGFEKVFFQISLDDIQKTIEKFPIDNSFLGQVFVTLAGFYYNPSPTRVLLPVVAGTLYFSLMECFNVSGIKTQNLPLGPLDEKAQREIVNKFWDPSSRPNWKGIWWEDHQPFLELMALIGTLPRGLETILESFSDNMKRGHPFEMLHPQNVLKRYGQKFPSKVPAIDRNIVKEILKLAFLGTTVDRLSPNGMGLTLEKLESESLLSFSTDDKIRIPYGALKLFEKTFGFNIISEWETIETSKTRGDGYMMECLGFFVLALRLLAFGKAEEPIPINVIFPGQFLPKTLIQEEVTVPDTLGLIQTHDGLIKDQTKMAASKPGAIFRFTGSHPGFDCCVSLPPHRFVINWKHITLSAATKVKGSLNTTKNYFEKFSEGDPWKDSIRVIITTGTGTLKEKDIEGEKVILISGGDCLSFFGPFFHLLSKE